MASVFLSYDHDDADRAETIALALEKAGHSVWWDFHVRGGQQFSKVIEDALKAADVVVVLWSANSVESGWVRDEAAVGRDSGRLVPASIDGTQPPLGFRQFQTIDLSTGFGARRNPKIDPLLVSVALAAGADGQAESTPAKLPRPSVRARNMLGGAAAAVLAVAAIAAGLAWQAYGPADPITVVAVAPTDSSPASHGLARDLLARLGETEPGQERGVRLVNADARDRANLLIEVGASSEEGQRRANLVFVDPKSKMLLWSKELQRPSGSGGDLREELGRTAALALRCALDAYQGGSQILAADILKLYIKGCAEVDDADYETALSLVPAFRQVVAAAPQFEAGWSKLLILETGLPEFSNDPELLRRHIASARHSNARLPAAYGAEMHLLPMDAWAKKLAIADHGVAENPKDSWLRELRAEVLFAVGRRGESVDDFRHAARADPLSQRVRSEYARWLGLAGQTQAAAQELREVERIWPKSASLGAIKFGFHLRYGDPRFAMQMLRSGKLPSYFARWESFLQARMNPTPANVDRALRDARLLYERDPTDLQHYVQALSIFDHEPELLTLLMKVPVDEAKSVTAATFRPAANEFWHNPGSLAYAKRVGLLEYWRTSGKWPDFCLEPDVPYDCKAEAAKLGT